MTQDKLLAEMQGLRDRITGITGTAVASRDGLIIVEDTGDVDPDNLAALTAAALALAQRLAREVGQGTLREAVTRSSGGYVAIYAIGTAAVLVLLGDEGLDITRLHRESRAAVDAIESLLTLHRRVQKVIGSPRIEASRISAMCATEMCSPLAASADAICSEQPGFAEMSRGAPAASTDSALRSPSSLAASGCSRL